MNVINVLILSINDSCHADEFLFKTHSYNTMYISLHDNSGKFGWFFYKVLYRLKLYKLCTFFLGYIIKKRVSFMNFDYIFINEGACSEYLIEYLLPRSNAKIVFQYWNTIEKIQGEQLNYIHKYKNNSRVFFQSFDYHDSQKYQLHYNYQFAPCLSNFPAKPTTSMKKGRKALFVGVDKNRLPKIMKVAEALDKIGFSSKLYIFPDIERNYSEKEKRYLYKGEKFDYIDIVSMINEIDVIIDIVQDGQNGMTWRPLEALFYQKKLITNFVKIINYDFYATENIFIIGRDDVSELRNFLEKPLKPISKKIKEKYTFDGCMEHIICELKKTSM